MITNVYFGFIWFGCHLPKINIFVKSLRSKARSEWRTESWKLNLAWFLSAIGYVDEMQFLRKSIISRRSWLKKKCTLRLWKRTCDTFEIAIGIDCLNFHFHFVCMQDPNAPEPALPEEPLPVIHPKNPSEVRYCCLYWFFLSNTQWVHFRYWSMVSKKKRKNLMKKRKKKKSHWCPMTTLPRTWNFVNCDSWIVFYFCLIMFFSFTGTCKSKTTSQRWSKLCHLVFNLYFKIILFLSIETMYSEASSCKRKLKATWLY